MEERRWGRDSGNKVSAAPLVYLTKALTTDQKTGASRDQAHERDERGKPQGTNQVTCRFRVWEPKVVSVCKG